MWQPHASFELLKRRAKILQAIRDFFTARDILEVETPLLSHATVTDPFVIGIPAIYKEDALEKIFYLQTSPEYAMKRLLAAGSGPIFQICKAFRQGDKGRYHNPEFTMLEWYRPHFDHHALMAEMDELLQTILHCGPAEKLSYANIFQHYLKIDPHQASVDELADMAKKNHISLHLPVPEIDKDTWLDILLTHCIEPHIGATQPVFIYDFPVTKAALAKIRFDENPPVASRFEVYFKGIELANGFHELQNVDEQRKRFEKDLFYREEHGVSSVPIDELFLSALEVGLPDCSGVALGVDRLIMLATECNALTEVVSFGFERA